MTTLQKLSKLFPKELSVGDVVETIKHKERFTILDTCDERGTILVTVLGFSTTIFRMDEVNRIKPNITLSMVLEAMNKKLNGNWFYTFTPLATDTKKTDMIKIRYKDFTLDKNGHSKIDTIFFWQLSKSLHEQSKETVSLLWEVLK